MRKLVTVYCSGGIRKGLDDRDKLVWTDAERGELEAGLEGHGVLFLNPEERGDDISNPFTVFGRDHYLVELSDFVVVDARQRRGIGVGIEMLSAKWMAKPLVVIVPPGSHYRRDHLEYMGAAVEGYVHAHLFGLADAIVDDFRSAGQWIRAFLQEPTPPKTMSVITKAIEEYRSTQIERDEQMRAILRSVPGR